MSLVPMVDSRTYLNSDKRLLKDRCENSKSTESRPSGKAAVPRLCDISFSRKDMKRSSLFSREARNRPGTPAKASTILMTQAGSSPRQACRCFVPLTSKKPSGKPASKIPDNQPKTPAKIEISLASYIDREFRFLQNHKINKLRETANSRLTLNSRIVSKSESLTKNPRLQTPDSQKASGQSGRQTERLTSPRRISQLIMQDKRILASPASRRPEQSRNHSQSNQTPSSTSDQSELPDQPSTKRKNRQPVPRLGLSPLRNTNLFSGSDGFFLKSTQRAQAQDFFRSKKTVQTLFGIQKAHISK